MYRILPVLLPLLASVIITACGGSGDEVAYRPFKTAVIPKKIRVTAVGCNRRSVAVCDVNGSGYTYITLYRIDEKGNRRETDRISNEDNDTFFGTSIAMNDDFLVAGSHNSARVHLYRLDPSGQADKMAVIEDIDKSMLHGRTISLDGNRLVIGSMSDKHPGRAWLYRIEDNGSVRLEHLFESPSQSRSYFANTVAIRGDTVAIGEAGGYRIHLYRIEKDGNVSETATFSPAAASPDGLYHFSVALIDGFLLTGSSRLRSASLFETRGDAAGKETPLPPADDSQKLQYGRSVAADDKTLLIESGRGVTLYRMREGRAGDPVTLTDADTVGYDAFTGMTVSGDRFVRLYDNGSSAFVYSLYPTQSVYVYSPPSLPISLAEASPPYNLFCVDAAATDGNLTYTLAGDDATRFEMNGSCLRPVAAFDYRHPADSNGDNDYNQSVIVTDPAGHTVSVRADVRVTAQPYRFVERVDGTDDRPVGTSLALWQEDLLTGRNDRVQLFSRENGSLIHRRSIVPPDAGGFIAFGSALALNDSLLAVSAPLEENNDTQTGAVYLYPRDDTAAPLRLVPDDLSPNATFGQALQLNEDFLAVGAPYTGNAYHPGVLYLYRIDGNGSVPRLVTELRADGNGAPVDFFGGSVVMDGNLLVVGSPGRDTNDTAHNGAVYVYTLDDATGTWTLLRTLYPPTPAANNHFGTCLAYSSGLLAVAGNNILYIYRLDLTGAKYVTDVGFRHPIKTLSMYGTEIAVGSPPSVVHLVFSPEGELMTGTSIRPRWTNDTGFGSSAVLGSDFFVGGSTMPKNGALYLYEKIRD